MKWCAKSLMMTAFVLLAPHTMASPSPDELMVAQFERADGNTELGQPWNTYTDTGAGGNSQALMHVIEEDGNHFMRIEVTIGDGARHPFAGIATSLNTDRMPRDMNGYNGVKLRTRSDSSYDIHLITTPVRDFNHFSATVSRRGQWTEVTIPFKRFKQSPWWGQKVEFDLTKITGIGIHLTGSRNASPMVVDIDDIQFY